jgi:prepilin-type N-terminal cleavage/methylation domain-containing protein
MKRQSGFTLIELIASIVVISIIAAAGTPVLIRSITAYNSSLNTITALDKLRYATDRMAREFREASANSTNLNMSTTAPSFHKVDYLIAGSTITTVTYTVAIASSGTNVNLTYTPSGGSATTAVLTDQLSTTANSLQFAYYDQNNATTATAASAKYVEIRLTLRANNQDYSSRTRVALQNP